jgi:hypothetical protein
VEGLLRSGVNAAAGAVGLEAPVDSEPWAIDYNEAKSRLEAKHGEFYKPQTTAEKYLRTVGEFAAPGGLVSKGTRTARAAQIAAPAIVSETAGQATEGTWAEPYARLAGALAGGTAVNAGTRVVTPAGKTDAVRAKNVAELERQGVDSLLAGQRTGNARIGSLEDASMSLPGGGRTRSVQEKAMEQFTGSALSKIGVTDDVYANLKLSGPRATDEVLEYAADQIGKRFENVAKVAKVVPDNQFNSRLNAVVKNYVNSTSQGNRVPKVQAYAQEIATEAGKSGGMNGQKYLAIRSALRKDQRAGDPALRDAASRLVEQLDAQMIRSAPSNLRPQVAKYIQDNNRQWRDYLAIKNTAARQGEVSSAGILSPQALNSEIKKQHKNLVSRNDRELGKLARAGDDVLRPLKSSGTAERTQAISLLKSPSSIASGGAGAFFSGGDPLMMGAAYLAPLAIQAGTARGISNPTLQRILSNQLVTGKVNPQASRGVGYGMAPWMLSRDDVGPEENERERLVRALIEAERGR